MLSSSLNSILPIRSIRNSGVIVTQVWIGLSPDNLFPGTSGWSFSSPRIRHGWQNNRCSRCEICRSAFVFLHQFAFIGGSMFSKSRSVCIFLAISILLALPLTTRAQGTLADYQRAQSFLSGNLRSKISLADLRPTWIEHSDRFWYRTDGPQGSQFILVDAAANTSAPAFDQDRLASALSRAAGHEYKSTDLPFYTFEYVDNGAAIRFQIADAEFTCRLSNYQCARSARPAA